MYNANNVTDKTKRSDDAKERWHHRFFCSFPAFPGQTIYLMQLCTQNAEAIAVRMVIMKLITVFQFSFFMLCIFLN